MRLLKGAYDRSSRLKEIKNSNKTANVDNECQTENYVDGIPFQYSFPPSKDHSRTNYTFPFPWECRETHRTRGNCQELLNFYEISASCDVDIMRLRSTRRASKTIIYRTESKM